MAKELSTAGITIGYAVESTAGTRPTTGYTVIPHIKVIPDALNPEPGSLDATDLSDLEFMSYILGLKDLGGSIAFEANWNSTFMTAWGDCVTAYPTDGKEMWWQITVPGITKKFYFSGEPSKLGFPGAEVNSVFGGNVYIAPHDVAGWDT